MQTVTVERSIAAPAEAVFDWLTDSRNYTKVPGVLSARLVREGAETRYGVGAVREITTPLMWFREEMTAHDRPHDFRYQIIKSIPPIRHRGGRMTFVEAGGATCVTWTTTVAVPLPLASTAVERALCSRGEGRLRQHPFSGSASVRNRDG